jgi:hypothetical protein
MGYGSGLNACDTWRPERGVRVDGDATCGCGVIPGFLRCRMSVRGKRRGANPCCSGPGDFMTGTVGDEETAGGCSDVGRRCWRQLCPFPCSWRCRSGSNVVLDCSHRWYQIKRCWQCLGCSVGRAICCCCCRVMIILQVVLAHYFITPQGLQSATGNW